jgi:hypothetical protein
MAKRIRPTRKTTRTPQNVSLRILPDTTHTRQLARICHQIWLRTQRAA